MSYRSRANPLSPGVIDLETARRAVAQVAQERDALAQQLQRAQAVVDSLRRQLEARTAESAELARAVRALQARVPADAGQLEEERGRTYEANEKLERLTAKLRRVEAQLQASIEERDVAAAERDRALAATAAAQAETRELGATSPDAERVQRLAADLERVRFHQQQAIVRGVRERTDHLLAELVSVRDSVERALDTVPDSAGSWHDGLLAVLARVDHVFEREGVQVVGRPGERFDPSVHDAVGTLDGPEGTIVETAGSGLVRADGSVVVVAKVLVGRGS